jgi:two-component system chemotaxis sensor kinase CheA
MMRPASRVEPHKLNSQPPPPTAPTSDAEIPLASERPPGSLVRVPEQAPRVTLGIRVKLVALMLATIFAIVGVLASYFPARQVSELRSGLRDRAAVYAQLSSQQLRSSIAFNDQETAREVLSAIEKDPLIDGISVFTEQGARLHGEGQLSALAHAARGGFGQARTFYLPGRVLATAPVLSLEGPKGTVVLELSTRPALQARNRLVQAALLVGAGALLIGSLAAWLIARSLARRVERVADAATKVAHGDLQQALDLAGPRDEIGVLSHGFNAMVQRLRGLITHIHDTAREESVRLEHLVQERTLELDRKNGDLRLVLDNVEQGFITVDREATIVGEHSRVIEDWFGALAPGSSLWPYLDRSCPGVLSSFQVSWTEVTDGIMPLEITLYQMPRKLLVGARHFALDYKPLGGTDDFEKLLVMISDVTPLVERERTEQEQRDILNVTSRLLNDRAGFLEFFAETQVLLNRIASNRSDIAVLKRDLHTLKGNTAIFGLSRLSGLCHELEDAMESTDPASLDHEPLTRQWQTTCSQLEQLLGQGRSEGLQIDESDYLSVLDAIRRGVDRERLTRMIETWRLEPMRTRLGRIGEQLSATAERLDKGPVEVVVDAPNLYLAQSELGEFWSVFSHVVRNAIAHGLESPDLRQQCGKPALARFELRAGVEQEQLFVEIQDSGPGVDWECVRERARQKGIDCETEDDLVQALFVDGISTETTVNSLSGRGVGLSSVHAVCARQSGRIDVTSRRGEGTCFRFSWPARKFKTLTVIEPGALS